MTPPKKWAASWPRSCEQNRKNKQRQTEDFSVWRFPVLFGHFHVWVTVWVRIFPYNFSQRKIPENRSFRGYLELLPRFELGTSSLPTPWSGPMRCVPTLSGRFCYKRMRSPALSVPYAPSAPFPVWVTVWVRRLSRQNKGVLVPFHLPHRGSVAVLLRKKHT